MSSIFRVTSGLRMFAALLCAFFLGGFAYYAIEVLWRGHSHITMWFCGAICLSGSFLIEYYCKGSKITKRALYSALLITVAEFIFGCIFNLWLQLGVWNYSKLPLNILGQICLPFSAIWYLLAFPAAGVCNLIQKAIGLQARP